MEVKDRKRLLRHSLPLAGLIVTLTALAAISASSYGSSGSRHDGTAAWLAGLRGRLLTVGPGSRSPLSISFNRATGSQTAPLTPGYVLNYGQTRAGQSAELTLEFE